MAEAPATKLPHAAGAGGAPGGKDDDRPIRVMVVDDSHLMCWLLTRWIGEAPGLELAGIASTGREAVATIGRRRPDIVLLDLEMPEMGGLEALPELMKACPSAKVIVVSALTKDNAGVALDALARGAVDYVSKPSASGQGCSGPEFRQALMKRIRAICRPQEPQPARRPQRMERQTNRTALGFAEPSSTALRVGQWTGISYARPPCSPLGGAGAASRGGAPNLRASCADTSSTRPPLRHWSGCTR